VSGQLHSSGHFTPKERASGTHWIGHWQGPRVGLDAVVREKYPAPSGTRTPRSSGPYSRAMLPKNV